MNQFPTLRNGYDRTDCWSSKQLPCITTAQKDFYPPDFFTLCLQPTAASWCKSQFAVPNGKGTVADCRLMLVIIDAHSNTRSLSNFLDVVCDGGFEVSITIDVGDHRRGRRRERARIDLVSQCRRKSERNGGGLRKDVP